LRVETLELGEEGLNGLADAVAASFCFLKSLARRRVSARTSGSMPRAIRVLS
jgi:hypothetical protein